MAYRQWFHIAEKTHSNMRTSDIYIRSRINVEFVYRTESHSLWVPRRPLTEISLVFCLRKRSQTHINRQLWNMRYIIRALKWVDTNICGGVQVKRGNKCRSLKTKMSRTKTEYVYHNTDSLTQTPMQSWQLTAVRNNCFNHTHKRLILNWLSACVYAWVH